jgi:hypothetical protein
MDGTGMPKRVGVVFDQIDRGSYLHGRCLSRPSMSLLLSPVYVTRLCRPSRSPHQIHRGSYAHGPRLLSHLRGASLVAFPVPFWRVYSRVVCPRSIFLPLLIHVPPSVSLFPPSLVAFPQSISLPPSPPSLFLSTRSWCLGTLTCPLTRPWRFSQ